MDRLVRLIRFVLAVIYIFGTYMGSVSVVTTVKWFWFFVGAPRTEPSFIGV